MVIAEAVLCRGWVLFFPASALERESPFLCEWLGFSHTQSEETPDRWAQQKWETQKKKHDQQQQYHSGMEYDWGMGREFETKGRQNCSNEGWRLFIHCKQTKVKKKSEEKAGG